MKPVLCFPFQTRPVIYEILYSQKSGTIKKFLSFSFLFYLNINDSQSKSMMERYPTLTPFISCTAYQQSPATDSCLSSCRGLVLTIRSRYVSNVADDRHRFVAGILRSVLHFRAARSFPRFPRGVNHLPREVSLPRRSASRSRSTNIEHTCSGEPCRWVRGCACYTGLSVLYEHNHAISGH